MYLTQVFSLNQVVSKRESSSLISTESEGTYATGIKKVKTGQLFLAHIDA